MKQPNFENYGSGFEENEKSPTLVSRVQEHARLALMIGIGGLFISSPQIQTAQAQVGGGNNNSHSVGDRRPQ